MIFKASSELGQRSDKLLGEFGSLVDPFFGQDELCRLQPMIFQFPAHRKDSDFCHSQEVSD